MQLNEQLTVKESPASDLHYHLENFEDIFRTGHQLWLEHENGIRSFAMLSTGYQTSQQKAIIGLASYFDLKRISKFEKIAIISHHLKQGIFAEFMPECQSEGACHHFYHHFDFIDWDLLLRNSSQGFFSEEALTEFLSEYSVILWDMPELGFIEKKANAYLPFLRRMESLCILSARGGNKREELDHIASYLKDYGFNLKHLCSHHSEKKKNVLFEKIKSFFSF